MNRLCSLRLLALLFLLLAGPGAWAQAPAWQSAMAVGVGQTVDSESYVTATATDASGHVYLTGEFFGTVRFGTTTLTSAGSYDVFVTKINPVSQQVVWVQRAGGTDFDEATTLAVSGTSVYVAGEFRSLTADFGTTSLATAGSRDVFVAKLTDAGATASFTWAQRAGDMGSDEASALAVSGTNVFVAGSFRSTVSFGSTSLTSVGDEDVFVAKLTDAGSTASFTWAQRAGGSDVDYATALAVSGTSVFVAGAYYSSIAGFGTTSLTNAGISDAFVAKLTDAGSTSSFTWTQRAGGAGYDQVRALAVRGTSVYVVGAFESTTSFGNTSLTSAGDEDVFVAKLTDAGSTASFTWAQRAGGTGDDFASALAVRGTSVFVAGDFINATASFGSTSLSNAGGYDAFVAKLTDAGSTASFAWAQGAGGPGYDFADALLVNGTSVYVAGEFDGPTVGFGPTTLVNASLGDYVSFLASFTDLTLTTTAPTLAGAGVDLYPNPAQGTATLVLPAGLGTAEAALTLADALGKVVRTQALAVPTAGRRYALDLRGLAPGVYALRVQAGAGAAVRRLVVE